jgi:hypothetical protein
MYNNLELHDLQPRKYAAASITLHKNGVCCLTWPLDISETVKIYDRTIVKIQFSKSCIVVTRQREGIPGLHVRRPRSANRLMCSFAANRIPPRSGFVLDGHTGLVPTVYEDKLILEVVNGVS